MKSSYSPARCLGAAVFAAFLLLASRSVFAAPPPIDTSSPAAFFSDVAGRLLRAELNLDLQHIQVYPTNQYTPVVQRLLQLTANIYDATTNRTVTGYPFLPSVFRPLFRRDNAGAVFIAGYREVTDDGLAYASTAPVLVDLETNSIGLIPLAGTAFGENPDEPLVWGVPLVIGAKKGFPNFNEFAMQTAIFVTRFLEFRRDPSRPVESSPVVETNQMFQVAITNDFGLEAWNSYTNPYPRNLELIASAEMMVTLTNKQGALIHSNAIVCSTNLLIPQGSWQGYTSSWRGSLVLPWGSTNSATFLANSTYIHQPPWLLPATHTFERQSGFYALGFILTQNTRVRFMLVDTDARRIVDCVAVQQAEPLLDLTAKLREGADCSVPWRYTNVASFWCTNRIGELTNSTAPTYGVMNQILFCLHATPDLWRNCSPDPTVGLDMYKAIDFFRFNLGLTPRYNTGMTFAKSNVFYAPFVPFSPIYVHTSWQANDPLVHYTMADLFDLDLDRTNRIDFSTHIPPLDNLGVINHRFEPWGGGPTSSSNPKVPRSDVSVKDLYVTRPDDWNFPSPQPLSVNWLGNVHRGTPWQTVFLKSSVFPHYPEQWTGWQEWLGLSNLSEAVALLPTNDWRIASLLASWINTNHPLTLSSVNQKSAAAWPPILDGLLALTNTGGQQVEIVVMTSNSPQAAVIAEGLDRTRNTQRGQVFRNVGDICATPELSVASPWINPANQGIRDAALEILPAQLLDLLRPDSFGSVSNSSQGLHVSFTGLDGYAYGLESSTNLVDWISAGTYYPSNGAFNSWKPLIPAAPVGYFRSNLLP